MSHWVNTASRDLPHLPQIDMRHKYFIRDSTLYIVPYLSTQVCRGHLPAPLLLNAAFDISPYIEINFN